MNVGPLRAKNRTVIFNHHPKILRFLHMSTLFGTSLLQFHFDLTLNGASLHVLSHRNSRFIRNYSTFRQGFLTSLLAVSFVSFYTVVPFLQRAASAVYATANLPVDPSLCLSATLRYCVKTRYAEGCGLHHRVAQWLQFSDAKNGCWGTTVQVKLDCNEADVPAKTADLYTFSLMTPKPWQIAKKVQLTRIESRPWASQEPSTKVVRHP